MANLCRISFSSALLERKLFAEYVQKYASEEALRRYCPQTDGPACSQARQNGASGNEPTSDSESTISDFSDDETKDMEL